MNIAFCACGFRILAMTMEVEAMVAVSQRAHVIEDESPSSVNTRCENSEEVSIPCMLCLAPLTVGFFILGSVNCE